LHQSTTVVLGDFGVHVHHGRGALGFTELPTRALGRALHLDVVDRRISNKNNDQKDRINNDQKDQIYLVMCHDILTDVTELIFLDIFRRGDKIHANVICFSRLTERYQEK
jgi:hypothetical protein